MNVLVDTSVWSLVLRRQQGRAGPVTTELANLVQEGRVVMLGAIRQELVSGIRTQPQFEKLREHLRAFPDVELGTTDYETAALYFNTCQGSGIQGSNTDFLLCAVAGRHGYAIFTTDKDFAQYARFLPVTLHKQSVADDPSLAEHPPR